MAQLTLDVADSEVQARFWSAALGYRVDKRADGNTYLRPPTNDDRSLRVWLQPVAETKRTKNRLHLDFDAADPAAEVERLLALGASRGDVGQTGTEGFVVLADPEGNEFCVFTAPRDDHSV